MPPGAEPLCPECHRQLNLIQSRGILPWVRALGGVILLGAVAAAAWIFTASMHRSAFPPLTNEQWNEVITRAQGPLLDEPITFRQGQTQLLEEDRAAIKDSLPKLERHPRSRILVEAHVAPSDSPEADQKLSDERALEVKKFLTADCAVPESRVFAKGCGSSQPPERLPDESEQEWKRRARSVKILFVGQ